MNRALKDSTVKRYYYQAHQLEEHMWAFLIALQLRQTAENLKILRGLTPLQLIRQSWQKSPFQFTINPFHLPSHLGTKHLVARCSGSRFPLVATLDVRFASIRQTEEVSGDLSDEKVVARCENGVRRLSSASIATG